MFLYRSEENSLEDLKLSIAKHRNGSLGTMDLKFKGTGLSFMEWIGGRKRLNMLYLLVLIKSKYEQNIPF